MEKQVFRSPTAVVVWWIWVLFAVGNLIDIAVQGRDHASLVAVFVLLVVTGAMWAGAQRPRLVADDDGLTIVNPLRDHRVGWAAVAAIDATDLIRVRCEWPGESGAPGGKKTFYAWAASTSRRRQAIARLRAERRARPRRGPSIGVFGAGDGVFGGGDGGFAAPGGGTGGVPGGGTGSVPRGGTGGVRGTSTAAAPGTPEAGDTEKIVTVLTARADAARAGEGQVPATRPVSTWYWPAFAAVGIPVLALLIVLAL